MNTPLSAPRSNTNNGPKGLLLAIVAALGMMASASRPVAAQTDDDPDAPTSLFIPVPIIFYTPETHFAFGAACSYLYRPRGSTVQQRPSYLGAAAIYTTRAQATLSLGANNYWGAERHNAITNLGYRKFPDLFFGIGNDTSPDGEDYTDEGASVTFDYLLRLFSQVRVGGGFMLAGSSITETEAGGLMETADVPGAGGGQVAGIGLQANYDNRDNVSYPRRGRYADVTWKVFDKVLRGDFAFYKMSLDLRHYTPLGRRQLVAARVLTLYANGNVPFQLMPTLGGESGMRGYFAGRFRDQTAMLAQLEFRFHIWRRLGGAVFGSAGQVAPQFDHMRWQRTHTAYGAGLRVMLLRQENLNLRFDLGFGEDESGFYFGVGESF